MIDLLKIKKLFSISRTFSNIFRIVISTGIEKYFEWGKIIGLSFSLFNRISMSSE